MRRACVCVLTGGLAFAGSAWAQPAGQPPAATQPVSRPPIPPMPPRQPFDENSHRMNLKNRTAGFEPNFVEIYKLDDAHKAKLHKYLEDLVEQDVKFTAENYSARMDAREAYYKANQDLMAAYRDKKDKADITQLLKDVQDRKAHLDELQKQSPWTPEKIASTIESMLPPDQAKAGHAEFEKRRNYPYLKMPPTPQQLPQPPQPQPQPQLQPPQPAAPLTPQTAQPTKFRNVTRVAPPEDQWDKAADQVITDRKFDAEQTAKARAIVSNIKVRYQQYEKENTDAYAKAKAMNDAAARDAELKKLDQGVNILYDEMMLRLDNLSRADQMPGAATQPAPKAGPTPPAQGGH